MPGSDVDPQVRLRAFEFLKEQTDLFGDTLPRRVLEVGFTSEGTRVPLVGPRGIFKPAILPEIPLTITTVPLISGKRRPYDDELGDDGFLIYRYYGSDPNHRDNIGLRLAAAFDANFLGIRPDLKVELRMDILDEADGPMLEHGLKDFQDTRIHAPRAGHLKPDRSFLEERYEIFRKAG